MSKKIKIGSITIGDKNPFVLIAGPCVIESEAHTRKMAHKIKEIANNAGIPFIFKSSFDKANRNSVKSYRGPGLKKGLKTLSAIKSELNIPIISDVHRIDEVAPAAEVLDIIQIPAFLCRQTDLILAAARTGKPVNIKKGQFMAPWDVEQIIDKIRSVGNNNIMLTERGTCFGYNDLVVDMRNLNIMSLFHYPVIFDATHSCPAHSLSASSHDELVSTLARAAVATGYCNAVYLEIHNQRRRALCDKHNMINCKTLKSIIPQLKAIRENCNV